MATVAQPVNTEDGEYNDICAYLSICVLLLLTIIFKLCESNEVTLIHDGVSSGNIVGKPLESTTIALTDIRLQRVVSIFIV